MDDIGGDLQLPKVRNTEADAAPENQASEDAPPQERASMRPAFKIALLIVCIVVIVAAIAYAIYWWTTGSYQQSTNDAYLQADQASVAPRVSGYVNEVLVRDNQIVTVGQVLARIDAREYVARGAEVRAQIEQAQASSTEADAQIRQQQAQITQAEAQQVQSRAQVRQYTAAATFSASQAARYRPLAAAGAETNEKLAQYNSDAKQSQAQMEAAVASSASDGARVESARRQIDIFRAQILLAEAKVRQGEAQLAASEVDIGATTVTSRINGRVGDKTVRIGQYVQAGTRLMTIVPIESLYVNANFKETQIGLMRVGQPATITVDALSGIVIHGRVESFSPGTGAQFSLIATDNATGNFTKITQRVTVRLSLDAGPDARRVLVPGLSVTAEVNTISAKSDLAADKAEMQAGNDRHRQDQQSQDGQSPRGRDIGAGHD